MGTNYYAVRNRPTTEEPIHIGKSSFGWKFSFQVQNKKWNEPPVVWNDSDSGKDEILPELRCEDGGIVMTSPCLHYDCENKNSFGYCKTSVCIHPKYRQQTVCGTYNTTPRVVIKPTIKPQSGKWIRNDNGTWSCDQCKTWIPNEQHHYARFCLYCGAKMEAET